MGTQALSQTPSQNQIPSPDPSKKGRYRFPDQSMPHQATWLQWPHPYQYGVEYANKLDPIWVDLTRQLSSSEQVRIIVFDENEQQRVKGLLPINIQNIRFYIHPTDDVWIRDNGPIFVRDWKLDLVVLNWGFNGWGKKADYQNCNEIPKLVAKDCQLSCVDLTKTMIIEGGSFEIDGDGVLLATQSSILNKNRNSALTKQAAQAIFREYLGVYKIIWLKGIVGRDITDMHIDGFARFSDGQTLVTMSKKDLAYWELKTSDINTLYNAKNIQQEPYKIVTLPLTKRSVKSSKGKDLGRASYINYYVANSKVIVPYYGDLNDKVASQIIKKCYPDKQIVGVRINDLFQEGGMIHCVTQQQPKP